MIGASPRRVPLAFMVGLLVLWPPLARATVYSWRGEGGVIMLSNDPGDVPEDQRASAQTYTAKPAPRRPPEEAAPSYPTGAETAQLDAYQRGFEQGLQIAERQVAFAEELARTILAAVPQAQPAPIVIQQPAPPEMPYGASPYFGAPYGPAGLYPPYLFGAPFGFGGVGGFGGRFVRHPFFFPGQRFFPGHRFGTFFPHGHIGFSRMAMGRMR